ncbi:MAG: hypothetical protein JO362_00850 [Streptomycetaceae bacterium]|nr:hypothetical protein [Streptomycetaceae bacterium]
MSLRTWTATSLVAALALAAAPTGAYAATMPVTTHHSASVAQVRGSGRGDDYDPGGYPDCRSRIRHLVIGKGLKADLFNGRRGPTAVIRSTKDNSVQTFLDVDWNPQTTGSFQLKIRGFFKIHPILVVKDFGKHKRFFLFPIRRCRTFSFGDHHHGRHRRRFGEYPSRSTKAIAQPRAAHSGTSSKSKDASRR